MNLPDRKYLIKEIDRAFSLYIRLRDTNDEGWGFCIATGHPVHFDQSDAGHYEERGKMNTRWNEKNVNIQSKTSNRFDDDQKRRQKFRIDQKWGNGTAEILSILCHRPRHYSRWELKETMDYYRGKARELANKKRFKVSKI